MTKRRDTGHCSKSKDSSPSAAQRKNFQMTFVQNSNETDDLIGTGAKASSIGSTDKRSQLSSDDLRKKEYMAITEPTMHVPIVVDASSGVHNTPEKTRSNQHSPFKTTINFQPSSSR